MNARQIQIISLMADGHTLVEIGRRMYVSERTVKNDLRKAIEETNATGRTHLVAIALRAGLIEGQAFDWRTSLLSLPWRVGRHQVRFLYAQSHPDPSKADHLIGMMDTPELAAHVKQIHNRSLEG